MEFSEKSSLPFWARPFLDSLLALNVDLVLDAVCVRLGFWNWGHGLQFQYFGIPFADFWAWFWVVGFFSFGYRVFARRKNWIGTWLAAPFAFVIGLLGVIATNALITFVIPLDYHIIATGLVLGGGLIIVLAARPRFYQGEVDSVAFWIPFLTHTYLLVAGLISGVIFDPPFLVLISVVMFGIALVLHRPSIQRIFTRQIAIASK